MALVIAEGSAAEKAYGEELVHVTTEDQVTLAGAVIRPLGPAAHTRDVAVVWVHGLTGSFSGLTGVRIGRGLAAHGFTFLTGNNRGHDFGYVLRRTPENQVVLGGGGWELLSESGRDVRAWVAHAAGQTGVRGVLLVGHSLGAIKVGHYAATEDDPSVLGVVAASAPGASLAPDPALLEQAQRLVEEGRGRDLLPWDSMRAGAGTTSAQSYLDRWRDGGRHIDVYGLRSLPEGVLREAPLVSRIRQPFFALYGSEETWVGGAPELERIRENATGAARVETRFFPGADHGYLGHEEEVADQLAAWAATL